MKTVRVAVADDSAFFREVVKELLQADGDIAVVAEATNADEAVRIVAALRPDLLILDIQMPGASGLSAISEVMARTPLPILVVTALPVAQDGGLLHEIVARGALHVIPKANLASDDGAVTLRAQVRELGSVRVVRRPGGDERKPQESLAPAPIPAAPALGVGSPRVIGIGASAGGPLAVAELLRAIPADFPACIAIVQHLSSGFAERFAQFLQTATRLQVSLAQGPCEPTPGTVLIAPDDRHLVASTAESFELSSAPPINGHRPAVDALLSSIARVHGRRGAGVILTGMGDDGTAGLSRLAAEGALTIAQDEATSAVYGMPRAAVSAGAAKYVLPLAEIAAFLQKAVR